MISIVSLELTERLTNPNVEMKDHEQLSPRGHPAPFS